MDYEAYLFLIRNAIRGTDMSRTNAEVDSIGWQWHLGAGRPWPLVRAAALKATDAASAAAHAVRPAASRVHVMDGLRGWAALSVMFAHLIFGVFHNETQRFLTPELKLALEPLLGGTLDVAVFFVVSGDALSVGYWSRQSREEVARQALKRYFRLFIPILASCFVVFVLIEAGLTFNHQAASILRVSDWLGAFLANSPSLLGVFGYAAFGVFFHHSPDTSLNPFLGTMQIELIGSVLVFVYIALDDRIRRKFVALAFVLSLCLGAGSLLACFPFGSMCGLMRARGQFARIHGSRSAQVAAGLAAVAALVLGTYCNRLWPGWFLPSIIASCVLVFAVYASRLWSHVFASSLSRWLGHISFPLYLMQFPVIASFTSGAVVWAERHGVLGPMTMWLIIMGSAALTLLAAVLFEPVETLTAWVGDLVYRTVMDRAARSNGHRQRA